MHLCHLCHLDMVVNLAANSNVISTLAIIPLNDRKFRFELHAFFLDFSPKLRNHLPGEIVKYFCEAIASSSRANPILNLILLSKLLSFLMIGLAKVTLIPHKVDTLFGYVFFQCLLDVVVAFL